MTKLKVGMKVVSEYVPCENHIVRTLLTLERAVDYSSGFCASADGGPICPCCNKSEGSPTQVVDSTWFKPWEGEKR